MRDGRIVAEPPEGPTAQALLAGLSPEDKDALALAALRAGLGPSRS
jgi:hypothetical protein